MYAYVNAPLSVHPTFSFPDCVRKPVLLSLRLYCCSVSRFISTLSQHFPSVGQDTGARTWGPGHGGQDTGARTWGLRHGGLFTVSLAGAQLAPRAVYFLPSGQRQTGLEGKGHVFSKLTGK